MSGVSAFRRAKILGLDGLMADGELCRAEVTRYLNDAAAKDERRLLWLVERAADQLAELLAGKERELAVAERFQHNTQADLQQAIDRYTEDFRFVFALFNLLKLRHLEEDAQAMAAYFRERYGKKAGPKKAGKRPPA
jgi:hypothetical protein